MKYLKTFFSHFLVVFFANYLLPGIEITHTKLPLVGGDIFFALGLGLLNSVMYPIVRLTGKTKLIPHLIIAVLVLNFVAYALLKVLPLGIHMLSFKGYFVTAAIVSAASFTLNFLHMKAHPPVVLPKDEPPKSI